MSRAEDIFQKLVYFGEDAIDEYIVNMQTEELFLDFKQAISIGKNGTTLHKATGEKTFREIVGAMKKGSEHALEEFGKLKMKN